MTHTFTRNLKLFAKWLLYCIALMVLALTVLMVVSAGQHVAARPSIQMSKDAQAACAAFAGPNAWYTFDKRGRVVCTNKRGDRLKEQP
jgi:hypothetical protein